MRLSHAAAVAALCTALAPGLAAAQSPRPAPEPRLLARAERILRQVPVIDGHNDVLDAGGIAETLDLSRPHPELHTDLPRLRRGRVGGQFWSAYIPADSMGSGALRHGLRQIDAVHRLIARHPELVLARTADQVVRAQRARRIASLIGVEGGHAIEGSLSALRMFHQLGVRYITLTHNRSTGWADSSGDAPLHDGLSPFGEQVVREMNRLGIFVDLSHVSAETMRDALRVSEAPVIFSHSSARGVTDHPRNAPDDVLRQLAANGGVIMITFVPAFVDAEVAAWQGPGPAPRASLEDVADHIDHVRRVAGIDHVGLGSDFDGITSVPEGLEDVAAYPMLFAELLRRGYTERELKKIAGLNVLRAMRGMEGVARRLRRERAPSLADIEPRKAP